MAGDRLLCPKAPPLRRVDRAVCPRCKRSRVVGHALACPFHKESVPQGIACRPSRPAPSPLTPHPVTKVPSQTADVLSGMDCMPSLDTKHFGHIVFEPQDAIEFPRGLPGFEDRRRFLAIRQEQTAPLVFLQSLEDPEL